MLVVQVFLSIQMNQIRLLVSIVLNFRGLLENCKLVGPVCLVYLKCLETVNVFGPGYRRSESKIVGLGACCRALNPKLLSPNHKP